MLRFLQKQLRELWTDEQYSEEFRSRKSSYKDFDHALKHIRKAAQILENMTEEADHSGSNQVFAPEAIKKYIADIMISALRLANVTPVGVVDAQEAILNRIYRKMGVDLSEDAPQKFMSTASGRKLSFRELSVGDFFIGFPMDGDNSGHGGFLGGHNLFKKTESMVEGEKAPIESGTAVNGRGVTSHFPWTMPVLKIIPQGTFGKTLQECQDEVNDWVSKRSCGYWNPHQIYTRLGSELGELGKEINHEFGPLPKKEGEKPSSVVEESGDIIYTVICLLNSRGLSLQKAFEIAMSKCYGRDKDRFPMVEPPKQA